MNRGTIPMEKVIRECSEIYSRMKRYADQRSMIHHDLHPTFFRTYEHGRSYQGYFRDTLTLMHVDGASWTLDVNQVIDEQWVRRARRKRSAHRQNAVQMRDLKVRDF